jgi:transposase
MKINTRGSQGIKEKETRKIEIRRGVLFHQDNVPSHKSCVAIAVIHNTGFENFQQSSYSSDLAPSDYFLFSKLKERLRGIHFSDAKR